MKGSKNIFSKRESYLRVHLIAGIQYPENSTEINPVGILMLFFYRLEVKIIDSRNIKKKMK